MEREKVEELCKRAERTAFVLAAPYDCTKGDTVQLLRDLAAALRAEHAKTEDSERRLAELRTLVRAAMFWRAIGDEPFEDISEAGAAIDAAVDALSDDTKRWATP
jgi:hypothetical protein